VTEPQPETTPAPTPAPVQPPVPPADPAAPAARPGRGRRTAAFAAAGVVAALLVGGGVWGSAALADADRTAPTRYWTEQGVPAAQPEKPAPVPRGELAAKLLPVPTNFGPGPDLEENGNDFALSGEHAIEALKLAQKGLSSTERKKRDDALADLKLKGLAGRSYTRGGGQMVLEVRLMQADPQHLGTFSEITKKLFDITGDDRDAPKIDGFPDAKCALLAIGEEKKEKVDSLDCVAVQGDVLVSFRAYGPKPFSSADAASFFKNQLSHLKSPGESV
jgi:hypothetical protein